MVLLCHLKPEVIQAVRGLILEDDKLHEYKEIFNQEINRGLDANTCEEATIKSIVTHVNKLPSGIEEGKFLGLDFSGPVIKVMLVKLENRKYTINQKTYTVPEKYMNGKAVRLFDFIAKSIVKFLKGVTLNMPRIPLGVTFGFPIEQTSLQDCKLIRWSKGFQCPDLVGKNVFMQLKESIRKFPELKKVFVIGILNDAVSAVLACAWQEPTCMIGIVVGPGSSCCYVEKVNRVTKYNAENYGIRDIYINLESSSLGNDGCLANFRCEFDEQVDEESSIPGEQIKDKLVSTVYFGNVAQVAILKCIEIGAILNGVATETMQDKGAFTIDHMARIESDPELDHTNCREVLTEFGYEDISDEDCYQVQFICRCVSRRSANLIAAELATIINRINVPFVTIAADGCLIKDYPNYTWYLTRKLEQLKKEECDFNIAQSQSYALGPAVMAALFGEDVMDRDEKFRLLPGFPMDKCHFGKTGKCLNPDCNSKHPCDAGNVNPLTKSMTTKTEDLFSSDCINEEEKAKKKGNCGACKGYHRIN